MMDTLYTKNSCVVSSKHLECFELLTENERRLLEDNRTELNYRPGETIIKQGTFFSNVVFLKEGLVKVYLEGEEKDLSLKIVPSNHFLGLSSMIETKNKYIYSASAFVPSQVIMYNKEIFTDIMKKNALFTYNIVNILNENTDQIYTRFYCMTCKQSHGKVADLLLCLAGRVFKGNTFELPITKGDFADLIGLSPESVSRIFKEFKEDKLIEIKGSTFELLDIEGLEKISKYG